MECGLNPGECWAEFCVNSPLFLKAEGARVAHQQWKGVRELCCKVRMWKSLVPLSELPTVVLTVKFRARSMAVFETRLVHLTSEKWEFFSEPILHLSGIDAWSCLDWLTKSYCGRSQIQLERKPNSAPVVLLLILQELQKGQRGCVLCANIIILGNNNTFHNPRTLQYQRGHDLQNGPIYIHQWGLFLQLHINAR